MIELESPPPVTAMGLGYQCMWEEEGVRMNVSELRQRSGELHASLRVYFEGRLMIDASCNLSALTTRTAWARDLSSRVTTPIDWRDHLEHLCKGVSARYRRGTPAVVLTEPEAGATEPTFLLGPLLPEQGATIVFGQGATGKSTLAAAICVSLASGTPVVGDWHPRWQYRCMVLDWEATRQDWARMVSLVARGAGISMPGTISYRPCVRSLASEVEGVAQEVTAHKIEVVVVDSVGLAQGSAREGADPSDAAQRMFEALKRLGCTSLLLDHVKGDDLQERGPKAIAKPIGSVMKLNWARAAWELRGPGLEDEQEGDSKALLLRDAKPNLARKSPPIGLAMIHGEKGIRFERTAIEAPSLVSTLNTVERMRRSLATGPLTTRQLAEELDVPISSVRTAMTRDGGQRFIRLEDQRIALTYHP